VEGLSLESLYAERGIDVDAAHTRMKALMDAEGLSYGRRSRTYNSRLAQELGKWAETQAGGSAIHDALFKAYFVDSLDISNPKALLDVAASVGLSALAAESVLSERTFREAIDEDWARSRQVGVTGVPTFVAGGYGVVGAQPYETLAALLENVSQTSSTEKPS